LQGLEALRQRDVLAARGEQSLYQPARRLMLFAQSCRQADRLPYRPRARVRLSPTDN
jgi:hypothetical protein